jgi:DNA-binding CsgD family transcriptional regulator
MGKSIALSARQLECLRLASLGHTSSEIASSLGISIRTVDQYFGEACSRLKVRNRTHAVAKAVAMGLIEAPAP